MCACMCVIVCLRVHTVCLSEKKTFSERERQRERETETERDTERHTQRERERTDG